MPSLLLPPVCSTPGSESSPPKRKVSVGSVAERATVDGVCSGGSSASVVGVVAGRASGGAAAGLVRLAPPSAAA